MMEEEKRRREEKERTANGGGITAPMDTETKEGEDGSALLKTPPIAVHNITDAETEPGTNYAVTTNGVAAEIGAELEHDGDQDLGSRSNGKENGNFPPSLHVLVEKVSVHSPFEAEGESEPGTA
jgi:hypothetical protein